MERKCQQQGPMEINYKSSLTAERQLTSLTPIKGKPEEEQVSTSDSPTEHVTTATVDSVRCVGRTTHIIKSSERRGERVVRLR